MASRFDPCYDTTGKKEGVQVDCTPSTIADMHDRGWSKNDQPSDGHKPPKAYPRGGMAGAGGRYTPADYRSDQSA